MNPDAEPTDEDGSTNHPTTRQLDVQYWYRRVYALCQSRLLLAADAEDATQETFVRGLANLDHVRCDLAVGGWLRRIAQNVCVDMIRRNQVRKTSGVNVQNVATDAVCESVSERDQCDHLLRLVQELPEPLRETVLLHYYDQMTYDEMASWLGVARSTVNQRLAKARESLKQKLTLTENAR
ncbi:RNA polymerase sigma factor [Stieleria sp. TO1_6]|uniref:RNA polymerase sigma factor n=1 Tax=Stieleria tagensis TaxID=2956795 RepID=UPI00209AC050|nr:RNA polymerase sigma factor [Stieleria tagensis]MCO8121799.1 RNA polymerase sigma factor [Stieleria tagensis]